MAPVRCYPREAFELILTKNLHLTKTDKVVDGERIWKTPDGKSLFISDITEDEALSQSYVIRITEEVARLGVEIDPPPFYPWAL